MLKEGYSSLNLERAGQVILILDASDSASDAWPKILDAASTIIQKLPGYMVQLYFLGNGRIYPSAEFVAKADVWKNENLKRGSLITPILSGLQTNCSGKIVVIGSGEIFDLDDWADTPFWKQLLLVKAGSSLGPNVPGERELSSPQDLIRELHNTLSCVKITGPGFMPYWWDSDAYLFKFENGVAALEASGPESLSVRFFAEAAEAILTSEAGIEHSPIEIEQRGVEEDLAFSYLTQSEQEMFSTAVRGESFTCPACGGRHDPGVIRCEQSTRCSIFGEVIYPSFGAAGGFFIFHLDDGRIRFRRHPRRVLRLADGVVAILTNGHATIQSYGSGKWRETGKMKNYSGLMENEYVVVA